ncbi:hypothetical protein B4N89_38910 [Embleya scabrispora]|uniref:Uncharacterized protein n=2 Tax=Embleya scabrispora TaxID=159449 RepID=A0A1T3NN44_9ACTN|nr:hypothetical protein B4N89_38910 [Embleya scabrispora]
MIGALRLRRVAVGLIVLGLLVLLFPMMSSAAESPPVRGARADYLTGEQRAMTPGLVTRSGSYAELASGPDESFGDTRSRAADWLTVPAAGADGGASADRSVPAGTPLGKRTAAITSAALNVSRTAQSLKATSDVRGFDHPLNQFRELDQVVGVTSLVRIDKVHAEVGAPSAAADAGPAGAGADDAPRAATEVTGLTFFPGSTREERVDLPGGRIPGGLLSRTLHFRTDDDGLAMKSLYKGDPAMYRAMLGDGTGFLDATWTVMIADLASTTADSARAGLGVTIDMRWRVGIDARDTLQLRIDGNERYVDTRIAEVTAGDPAAVFRRPAVPTTTVSGFGPPGAGPGDTVTVTGSGLDAGGIGVYVDGSPERITGDALRVAADGTSLAFAVPVGATPVKGVLVVGDHGEGSAGSFPRPGAGSSGPPTTATGAPPSPTDEGPVRHASWAGSAVKAGDLPESCVTAAQWRVPADRAVFTAALGDGGVRAPAIASAVFTFADESGARHEVATGAGPVWGQPWPAGPAAHVVGTRPGQVAAVVPNGWSLVALGADHRGGDGAKQAALRPVGGCWALGRERPTTPPTSGPPTTAPPTSTPPTSTPPTSTPPTSAPPTSTPPTSTPPTSAPSTGEPSGGPTDTSTPTGSGGAGPGSNSGGSGGSPTVPESATGTGGSLSRTGADIVLPVLLGTAALGAGLVLLFAARSRSAR